ncbi:General secretion pathway protein K [Rubripirellula obstinata]|uniref:General secretion pathway protein K n=1 Tax=Rubripirellula obstinata TaxID=406547 RepID=A0A5B1CGV8_9BACT|nr:type II secretion system protein GspK [Rubripirellula obstinata]KAA1259422.1 General secretion pathway protein K [Rubripirellula obstinata]
MRNNDIRNAANRRGFFLVIVLIVVAVATMAVYSFTELMVSHDDAAYLAGDVVQARVSAESGAESIRVLLAQPPQSRLDFGGTYNNAQLFQAMTVTSDLDADRQSSFSVISPSLDENGSYAGIRYGLQDESARLNINALPVLEQNSAALMPTLLAAGDQADDVDADNIAFSLLMALPNMTADVADAILDWVDEDDEARETGAESDYYEMLPTPYSAANGPIRSVDELLLVRGVTPTLLFGADSNRNGVMDADEQQRFNVTIDTPGALGWSAYLTVHGAEANKTVSGSPRVNINQDDLEVLYEELLETNLGEIYATYIIAFRIGGFANSPSAIAAAAAGQPADSSAAVQGAQGRDGGLWTADLFDQLDLSGGGGTNATQILDLLDSEVVIGTGDDAVVYTSPFVSDPVAMSIYMADLMDSVTTQDSAVMPGRINLNECPAELLYGIPLLSEESASAILQERNPMSDDPGRRFETWPLAEGLISLDEMRSLVPLLCGSGDVYRAQIIGYFDRSGISRRVEAIIDATTVNPKLVSWRDLSHLGRGFDQSVLGSRTQVNY